MNNLEEKLALANKLRESEDYGGSAKEFTECLIGGIEDQNYRVQIHALCGHSLIYKILTRKKENATYKELTVSFCKEALSILEAQQEQIDAHTQSIALSSYADALLTTKQYSLALSYFEKSLKISPASVPEKGRLKAHIGTTKYLLGEKQDGIRSIEEGLQDIRTGNMDEYNIRVWETGCLNGLAQIYLHESDISKANEFIAESLKIATEHNLIIRKREAEDILSQIASRT